MSEFWLYKLLLRVLVKTYAVVEAVAFPLGRLLVATLDSLNIGPIGERGFDAEKSYRMC